MAATTTPLRYAIAAAAMLALGGCGSLTAPPGPQDEVQRRVEEIADVRAAASVGGAVTRSHQPYWGRQVDAPGLAERLPPDLEGPNGFVLTAAAPLSVREVASRIADVTGLVVRTAGCDAGAAAGASPAPSVAGAPGLLDGVLGATGPAAPAAPASFAGPLSGYLDQVATAFDAEADYDTGSGILTLTCTATRSYVLKAGPAAMTYSATVKAEGTEGGASGQTEASADLDVWAEVERQVEAITAGRGRFSASRATGYVVVTAPPSVQRAVAAYMDEVNARFAARVAVEVTALFVDVLDVEDYGFSLRALYRADNGLAVGLADLVPQLRSLGGTGNIAVVDAPAGSTASHFETTEALVRALAQRKVLSDVRNASFFVRSGTPQNVQMTTAKDYIKKVQASQIPDAGLQISADTEVLTAGFSLQILPRVVSRDEIDLHITFSQSDIIEREEKALGDFATIQLTEVPRRAFQQAATLAAGETMVIGGYELETASNDDQGMGDPTFWGLGGRQQANRQKSRIILLVTAALVEPVQQR